MGVLVTVGKITLADDENYRIVFSENTSPNGKYKRKILVGFGEIGAGIDSQGFGSLLAEKLGISYIAVNQAKRTRYQFLSRESLTMALAPLQRDYDLYFYGTSLGGYAAAYYGRPLGANFLALSPRLPIHPITDKRSRSASGIQGTYIVRWMMVIQTILWRNESFFTIRIIPLIHSTFVRKL